MEKYPVLLNEAPPGSNARGAVLTIPNLQPHLTCAAYVLSCAKVLSFAALPVTVTLCEYITLSEMAASQECCSSDVFICAWCNV